VELDLRQAQVDLILAAIRSKQGWPFWSETHPTVTVNALRRIQKKVAWAFFKQCHANKQRIKLTDLEAESLFWAIEDYRTVCCLWRHNREGYATAYQYRKIQDSLAVEILRAGPIEGPDREHLEKFFGQDIERYLGQFEADPNDVLNDLSTDQLSQELARRGYKVALMKAERQSAEAEVGMRDIRLSAPKESPTGAGNTKQ
jgi:hypothetical protein